MGSTVYSVPVPLAAVYVLSVVEVGLRTELTSSVTAVVLMTTSEIYPSYSTANRPGLMVERAPGVLAAPVS